MVSLTDLPQSTFWVELEQLKNEIRSKSSAVKLLQKLKENSNTSAVHETHTISDQSLLVKIENIMQTFLEDLANNRYPKFTLNRRGIENNTLYTEGVGVSMLNNVTQHVISLENTASLRKFTAMITCLATCYKLLQSNTYATKRDIYYSNVNFFQNQHLVDECMSDISCMLGVPRHNFRVLSSSKGLIGGCVKFKDTEGNIVDCSEGIQIPNHVTGINEFISEAKYILVIEKEATYQRLIDVKLTTKCGPCILITGKGFPDINTRIILRKLSESLQIPVLALVDADPHGMEIMCVYKYGSMSLSHEASSLTCPSMRWLGILPGEIERLGVALDVLIKFTEADRKKASDLLRRQYIIKDPRMKKQIEMLALRAMKAEIECLDSISYSFMSDIYLPSKIRNGEWI